MMGETNYKQVTGSLIDRSSVEGFITNLNILIKNIRTYPPGHSAISKTVEMLSTGLPDIFVSSPVLIINAIRNSLLANGSLINFKNPHIQNFALFISRLGIASFTLKFGMDAEELERFCRLILSVPPHTHIYEQKNILGEINSLPHLTVREIDLSAIRFSDEDTADSTRETQLTMWQEFMLGCLSPELKKVRDPSLLESIRMYERGSLHSFLQAFAIPTDRMLESYEAVIREHFSPACNAEDDGERKTFFQNMHQAFGQLNPDLKENILTTTFDALNNSTSEQSLGNMLKCIPGDMIVDVLSQAVLDKKVISPTFIKLMSVMYRAGKQSPEASDDRDRGSRAVWSRIEELFSRKGYEKYLAEDYAEQLLSLSLESDSTRGGKLYGFSCEKYRPAFQGKTVNRHLTTALLFLMQRDIEEAVYIGYTDIISQLIPELLETGDYNYLLAIYRVLKKRLKKDSSPAVSRAIARTLRLFLDSALSARLEEDYGSPDKEQSKELEELVIINGHQNLTWLIGQYLAQEDEEIKHRLYKLIHRFGPRCTEYTLARLAGSKSKETVELLRLIQNCISTTSSVEIFNLLKNNRLDVQLEAIRTLLIMKDPRAEKALLEMLLSRDMEAAHEALKIARDYKVQDLAPVLTRQIKTLFITRTTLAHNKAFLSLLGTFGNAEALPGLKKIAKTRFSLTPLRLRQTLEHLFKTLAGYSKSSAGELITLGLQSNNENIRTVCETLTAEQQDEPQTLNIDEI